MKRTLMAAVAAFALTSAAAAQAPAQNHAGHMGMNMAPMPAIYMGQADKPGAPVFEGLGAHKHPISTRNPETQKLFDQGVNLLFGFNHAEAIRSFREAARLDPDCAMCWWGISFALGSNINLAIQDDAIAPAWQALQQAQDLAPKASPAERAWIAALAKRYSADPKADRAILNASFATAMGRLAKAYPNDLDAATFYAEAMMDTQPWDYWQADGKTPKGYGGAIVATLERTIKRAPNHPGALHLYIHAVEASTTPERAEVASDRLLKLMPGAGHVVHMPSHIYYRVGRYADAYAANEAAAKVDEGYIATCRAQGFYPLGYYGHNIHFLWTSASMEGRHDAALSSARRLVKSVDAEAMAPAFAVIELYTFTPVLTELRFGKWDAILAEPAPPEALTLDTAMWRYARAFAYANKGDMAAAKAERDKLTALGKADLTRYDAFAVPAKPMIELAGVLVDGEMARLSGNLPAAVATFQGAAALEKALPYTEPAYWHQPVSHLLGAALMQAGRAPEAEAVYRESLKTYRRDGWALFGLAQALKAEGKSAEAAKAEAEFKAAWPSADTTLTASRL